MPPTAFGNLPPPAVPVVILGPLAFPLGIFAPCAFWFCPFWFFFVVLGPLGSFWVPLVLPGHLCPLCLVVLFALPFLAFFVAVGFFFGPLVLPWASLPLCAFWLCFRCPPWVFLLFWGPLGSPGGISAPCALWLWLFRPLGSLWSFCVAIGSFFGLLGSVLCFLLCRLALLFWALCPSGLWPHGRLFFCSCGMGARRWAFCAFALSFLFCLGPSLCLLLLVCRGAFACAGPLAGVPVGLKWGLCCLLGCLVPLLGFL